jgi:hypothetical protein
VGIPRYHEYQTPGLVLIRNAEPNNDMSESEKKARESLIKLCREIAEDYDW